MCANVLIHPVSTGKSTGKDKPFELSVQILEDQKRENITSTRYKKKSFSISDTSYLYISLPLWIILSRGDFLLKILFLC